jgi:transposase
MDRPCSRPQRLSESGGASKGTRARAMSRTTNAVAVSTIGIDTGKNTLHLIGLNEQGMIVWREKLGRGRIGGRVANVPRCLIGIEAGMGTHYVARELISLGHDVRQVPPAYAQPFRQTHKNDLRDAYAIATSFSASTAPGDSGQAHRRIVASYDQDGRRQPCLRLRHRNRRRQSSRGRPRLRRKNRRRRGGLLAHFVTRCGCSQGQLGR